MGITIHKYSEIKCYGKYSVFDILATLLPGRVATIHRVSLGGTKGLNGHDGKQKNSWLCQEPNTYTPGEI